MEKPPIERTMVVMVAKYNGAIASSLQGRYYVFVTYVMKLLF